MSLKNCIIEGVNEGRITQQQAQEATDLFESLESELVESLGVEGAAAAAGRQTFDQLKYDAVRRKQHNLLRIKTFAELQRLMREYKHAYGTKGASPFKGSMDGARPGKAMQAMLFWDETAPQFSSNLHGTYLSARRQALAQMSEGLRANRQTLTGRRGKSMNHELLKEVFGEDSANPTAKLVAEQWAAASEYLRLRANAAGMAIAKRNDAGYLPQKHDQVKVRSAGKAAWISGIRDKLDLNKMIDERTGKPFRAEALELALNDVYETISSGGLNKVKSGSAGAGKSLANRRMDHRFLVFKNAEAWQKYMDEFGDGDVFDTMIGHIDAMSKDIAMLEQFGPNPTTTIEALKIEAQKIASADDARTKSEAATNAYSMDANKFDDMLDLFTGEGSIPANVGAANAMSATRNLLQASLLGGVTLIAMPTDIFTSRMTGRLAGIPTAKLLRRAFTQFVAPLSAQEKAQFAVRLGIAADNWMTHAHGQARFFGELTGPQMTQTVSDVVLRGTALSHWTQAIRQTFGLEFLGHLGELKNKKFGELPATTRNTLEAYGIAEDRWNIIRSTDMEVQNGADFVRPLNIEERAGLAPGLGREIATQLMSLIENETNKAVPQATLRSRASLVGNRKRGTLGGEIVESFAQFKSFPVSVLQGNLLRYLNVDGLGHKALYTIEFVAGMTIAGALGLQAREMAKGRDPRNMNDMRFWGSALLMGGGLGLFGDFLYSDLNRYGGGLGASLGGPVAGTADQLRNLTMGNAAQAVMGQDTNTVSEMIKFAARNTPGANIWYIRLALERLAIERLGEMADPRAHRAYRRTQRKYLKEYNQRYWWAPGRAEPHRAPDLSAAWQ
jgi:hypothetical protein